MVPPTVMTGTRGPPPAGARQHARRRARGRVRSSRDAGAAASRASRRAARSAVRGHAASVRARLGGVVRRASGGGPASPRAAAAMRSRRSRRSTIMSIAPCSSRNSLRWKPSGSVSRTVCSITRGPAKPISARGSAMLRSPSIARLADTPPVVGSVSTEMNGSRACAMRASTALVLLICSSDSRPSCMRAPPLDEKQISGRRCSRQCSAPRAKRSPTTEPIEPPRKRNSNAQATTLDALQRARP